MRPGHQSSGRHEKGFEPDKARARMNEQPSKPDQDQKNTVPSWGLLAITAAYNRGEFSFEQWMKLSREWAEAMIYQAAGVCRAQKTPDMKAHAFYYYHPACWDTRHAREQSEPLSLELKTTEETPLPDGSLRLVSLTDMKPRTTCAACHRPFKSKG